MSDYFIGEIRAFGFDWPPHGWALAKGDPLQILQNQALFALIGITYGGSGSTFNLPDLRGRAPISYGPAQQGISAYAVGNTAGQESVVVTANTMPAHTHTVYASTNPGVKPLPEGDDIAAIAGDTSTPPLVPNVYGAPTHQVVLHPTTLAAAGDGAGHNNMQPFAVVNYCIALSGIFPTRE